MRGLFLNTRLPHGVVVPDLVKAKTYAIRAEINRLNCGERRCPLWPDEHLAELSSEKVVHLPTRPRRQVEPDMPSGCYYALTIGKECNDISDNHGQDE